MPAPTWLLLLLLGTVPLGAVQAEEGDAAVATAKPSTEESDAGADSGNGSQDETSQDQGKPSADVFIPSEEISEDFAVSFPVDI